VSNFFMLFSLDYVCAIVSVPEAMLRRVT